MLEIFVTILDHNHRIRKEVKMLEVNPILNKIKELRERTDVLRGYL
jgi:hypothetical protein